MDEDKMNFEANFSVLDRYGTDVTKEEYITDPAIGRDQQIKDLILVLLTPEKSAILIGKPGIGKTAIVEGLAYRIQKNDVPDALQGYTILNIKTASLLGTMPSGESKVQKMIDELKTKEKMILFIDEIHMLIGSTETSSLDFANIFKEGLGRGSIKVIGATTTEEYERYILRDKAFTRRFQKIEVPEPTREETIKIMMGTLPKFEKQTGRKMKYTPFLQERIMSFLVDITSEYKRIFALGSRYPDVCLTLLKQAFSYTVYDNRPYMDIFDIRKAIENSKNIYPDVIKKEMPNFDKMFNDLMLEEKGEKPIEEWRKDGTLTRNDIENQSNGNNNSKEENEEEEDLSMLENVPEMVDRIELRNSKPISNIITSQGKKKYAKVGSTAVSTGLKEKLNKTTNSNALDDMILSTGIDTLKVEPRDEKRIVNYVVTDEIRPGVDDNFLLGRPIQSNAVQEMEQPEEEVFKYRGNKRNRKNEGMRMWNNDYRPERQDISNQNFDKYQNYFHQDNNQNSENEKRIDMLMSGSNYNNGPMGNQMGGPMNDPMYGQMNGQMGGPMNDPMYGQMNGQMGGPMNDPMYGQMNGPMGGQMNEPMYGQMNGPMNGPMNEPMYGQMNGPMNGPMNEPMYGPMNGPMNDPMYGQMNGPMNEPMYGPMNNSMNAPMSGPLEMNASNQSPSGNGNNTFFGTPAEKEKPKEKMESLFGAPMYSEDNTKDESNDNSFGVLDDQLLADNMSLKNGEIVNEFPTFEKLNNLTNIATSSNNDDQNITPNGFMMNNNPTGFMNNNPTGFMNNNPTGFMNNNPTGFMMNNDSNMPMNDNRNWTFVNQNNQPNQTNNSSFFQKNILDEVKNKKESSAPSSSMPSPTNNKDYYEDMKSGDFVNFSDLSSGKVKEEDTNKYMGVQTEENKPKYDLNLENGSEEENKFDDFFE